MQCIFIRGLKILLYDEKKLKSTFIRLFKFFFKYIANFLCLRKAAKKVPSLVVRPLREGGGVKDWPLRKNNFFFKLKKGSDGH